MPACGVSHPGQGYGSASGGAKPLLVANIRSILVGPMGATEEALLRRLGVTRARDLLFTEGHVLPVAEPLEDLFVGGGLARGTVTGVTGLGATSLVLALVARATRDTWVAVVDLPDLGLVAASELGVSLDRLVCIRDTGRRRLDVLSALVDAFDVVVTAGGLPRRDEGKLGARVREHDAVVLGLGTWDQPDLGLHGTACTWEGLEAGHGHLTARRLTVVARGRGAARMPRERTIWLPEAAP